MEKAKWGSYLWSAKYDVKANGQESEVGLCVREEQPYNAADEERQAIGHPETLKRAPATPESGIGAVGKASDPGYKSLANARGGRMLRLY